VFPDTGADLAALDVQPNTPPEETLARADRTRPMGTANTLVLRDTDLFGATPCSSGAKLAIR
jgi:PTS system ascorbate-specific IIA component